MSMWIPSPKAKCPYCGSWVSLDIHISSLGAELPVRQLATCNAPESGAEPGGCGRDFVISGTISIEFPHRCLKIEGQKE